MLHSANSLEDGDCTEDVVDAAVGDVAGARDGGDVEGDTLLRRATDQGTVGVAWSLGGCSEGSGGSTRRCRARRGRCWCFEGTRDGGGVEWDRVKRTAGRNGEARNCQSDVAGSGDIRSASGGGEGLRQRDWDWVKLAAGRGSEARSSQSYVAGSGVWFRRAGGISVGGSGSGAGTVGD